MEEKITLRSTTFHHVAFDFIDGVISVPGLVVCSKKTRIDFLRVIARPGRQRSALDASEQIGKKCEQQQQELCSLYGFVVPSWPR